MLDAWALISRLAKDWIQNKKNTQKYIERYEPKYDEQL